MAARLILVTTRAEKAEEARRMGFAVEQQALDLPEPQALDPAPIAEAKARAAYERLSCPVLVEDSGLAVAAWGGFPGALVKWMEESVGLEGMARMLDSFPDRSATAVCVVASFDGRRLVAARGESRGSIAPTPRGSRGFGWDRLFVPEEGARTFAELLPAEKDAVSHRRRAWQALSRLLPRLP
jgi:XTP/dITP diphosphohydrolase